MSFKPEHCYDQTQVKSVAYADFVDARGELLLKDTREHTHAKVFLKELWFLKKYDQMKCLVTSLIFLWSEIIVQNIADGVE